ncbi:hypothetical protein GHYDROH2_27610 [Geobacter hydrogenophilus]|uniref:Uncharacterized protein n=1 Tax=Geobacter hydrogenophilus TaxID=40983 RepID=A0A9W6G1Q7_9BACT|nr:hypothetical protein GHYDROH2_27610 [Geobacter hydrogenophilus]
MSYDSGEFIVIKGFYHTDGIFESLERREEILADMIRQDNNWKTEPAEILKETRSVRVTRNY